MSAHRYWRIYITAGIGSTHLDISEIQMRTAIGGADQCTGGTPIYSAQSSGFEASKAFDDSTSTTWYINMGTYPLPQWIGYDFGAGNEKDIVEFALTCWNGLEMAKNFELQYSDDASTWTRLYTRSYETGWSAGQTRAYSSNSAWETGASKSFWRVRSTAVNGSTVFGLSELEMWTSTAGGANACTGGTAYASSQQEGTGPASEAFDGIKADSALGSYWSGTSTQEWIGYKFAGTPDIAMIAITARHTHSNQAPTAFVLEYWNGTNYTTVMSLSGITGWTSGQTRYFTAAGEVGGPVSAQRPVVFICC